MSMNRIISLPYGFIRTSEGLPDKAGPYRTIIPDAEKGFKLYDQMYFTNSGFWIEDTVAWKASPELRMRWLEDQCIHCNGTGFVAGVLDEPCDTCGGMGYIKYE